MTDDLVKRLREGPLWNDAQTAVNMLEAADRIEELERHVELRDFFLVENDLWERFAKGAEGKMNDK